MDLKPSYEELAQRLNDLEQEIRRLRERERNYRDLFNVTYDAIQLTAILEPDVLLNQIVTLLQQRFNLYHVHVYLLDPASGILIMQAGSGEVGQKLRQQKHRIPLEQSRSLVARAARERTIVVVDDVQNEPDFLPNPLLPQTRAEVSVPLLTYDRLIGVLDIQENKVAAFSQADLDIFNVLAGQIAIALQNATLFAERKQIEAALRTSEATNRALLEAIPDAIFQLDQEGTYLQFIPAPEFKPILPPAEFLGKKQAEVLPPDLAQQLDYYLQQALQTRAVQYFEYPLTLAEETKYYEARLVASGTNQVLGIVRDITDRKQAEQSLRESEEKYRSIVENALVGIFTIDDFYRFIYVNDKFCQFLGYTREEIIGMDFRQLLTEHSREFVTDRYIRRQRGEPMPNQYELELVCKNGELRYGDMSVSVVRDTMGRPRSIGQLADITERKLTEEALRVKDYAMASSNAIAMADLAGNITYVNPSFLRMWGYSAAEQVLGRSAIEFWREPAQAVTIITALQQQPSWQGELVARRNDGSLFNVELSASVVTDAAGQPVTLMASFVDVTERKRVEAEREALIQELEAKNSELERFTYTVSHDLKSPLVTIKGFLGLLQKDLARGRCRTGGQRP